MGDVNVGTCIGHSATREPTWQCAWGTHNRTYLLLTLHTRQGPMHTPRPYSSEACEGLQKQGGQWRGTPLARTRACPRLLQDHWWQWRRRWWWVLAITTCSQCSQNKDTHTEKGVAVAVTIHHHSIITQSQCPGYCAEASRRCIGPSIHPWTYRDHPAGLRRGSVVQ